MTTIIAARRGGVVAFGWDSQVTMGGTKKPRSNSQPKVFVNDGVVIGCCGSTRVSNIVEFMPLPERKTFHPNFTPRRWVITEFVPALFDELGRHQQLYFEDKVPWFDGSMILFLYGALLEVDGWGSVVLYDQLVAIGSGANFAMSAYQSGKTVLESLSYAAEQDTGTSAPFFVKTADDILNGGE